MSIRIDDKEYTLGKVKARMFRKAVALTDEMNLEKISVKDLDDMVDFVVEAYGNQFTRDDLYDGIEAKDLMEVLSKCITDVVGGVANKLESKNV